MTLNMFGLVRTYIILCIHKCSNREKTQPNKTNNNPYEITKKRREKVRLPVNHIMMWMCALALVRVVRYRYCWLLQRDLPLLLLCDSLFVSVRTIALSGIIIILLRSARVFISLSLSRSGSGHWLSFGYRVWLAFIMYLALHLPRWILTSMGRITLITAVCVSRTHKCRFFPFLHAFRSHESWLRFYFFSFGLIDIYVV